MVTVKGRCKNEIVTEMRANERKEEERKRKRDKDRAKMEK